MEIGLVVLEKSIFKFRQYIFCYFVIYLSVEKFFIWKNLNSLHPRMLYANFGWSWPSGSEEDIKVYKQTDGRTDRPTDDRRSEKHTWAFSFDEPKPITYCIYHLVDHFRFVFLNIITVWFWTLKDLMQKKSCQIAINFKCIIIFVFYRPCIQKNHNNIRYFSWALVPFLNFDVGLIWGTNINITMLTLI